MKRLAI